MKKRFAGLLLLLLCILSFSACEGVGSKSASLSLIYSAAALLSLFLLIGCLILVKKQRNWFLLLFSSVFIVNVGYTLLSVSNGLEMALWANRLAYLGSVFLPLAMLMILLNVTGTKHPFWLHGVLGGISLFIFLIAATPGILPIYYKEVSFAVVDGVSTLVKTYGPLHPLCLIYLLSYFSAMVALILRARVKKTLESPTHAVILAMAVFVNIGVWLIEQLTSIDFEMLSVSYIISELFLLGVHLVMNDYQRMKRLLRQVEASQSIPAPSTEAGENATVPGEAFSPDRIEFFTAGLQTLTPTEKAIYDAYLVRSTTKEIMAKLEIKESTLKFHNRNLYSKLGVSSRKELMEIYKYLSSVKAVLSETEGTAE